MRVATIERRPTAWPLATALALAVASPGAAAAVAALPHAPAPPVAVALTSYAGDVRDKSVLAGASEFLFLGEVVAQVGTDGIPTSDPEDDIPVTLFAVAVIEPVKGVLPGAIVVGQYSHIDAATGEEVLFDGDPILQPGEVVLFAVNPSLHADWYTIVGGPYGALRAPDAAAADALVAQFRVAAENPVVPVPNPRIRNRDDLERIQRRQERRRARHERRQGEIAASCAPG